MPNGKILQYVQTTDTTNRSTTSTSYVTTSVTADITPANTANKIMLFCGGCIGASTGVIVEFTFFRDAVDLTPSGVSSISATDIVGNADGTGLCVTFIDAPSSTSSITYSLRWKVDTGTGYLGRRGTDTGLDSATTLTLLEIDES